MGQLVSQREWIHASSIVQINTHSDVSFPQSLLFDRTQTEISKVVDQIWPLEKLFLKGREWYRSPRIHFRHFTIITKTWRQNWDVFESWYDDIDDLSWSEGVVKRISSETKESQHEHTITLDVLHEMHLENSTIIIKAKICNPSHLSHSFPEIMSKFKTWLTCDEWKEQDCLWRSKKLWLQYLLGSSGKLNLKSFHHRMRKRVRCWKQECQKKRKKNVDWHFCLIMDGMICQQTIHLTNCIIEILLKISMIGSWLTCCSLASVKKHLMCCVYRRWTIPNDFSCLEMFRTCSLICAEIQKIRYVDDIISDSHTMSDSEVDCDDVKVSRQISEQNKCDSSEMQLFLRTTRFRRQFIQLSMGSAVNPRITLQMTHEECRGFSRCDDIREWWRHSK